MREEGGGLWMRRAVGALGRSQVIKFVLIAGAAVGIGGHLLVGYLGPGDLFQDFVGAKEFAARRSMNPTTTMHDRVEYWSEQEHLQFKVLLNWPALRNLQRSSIDSGARQLVVQAHPPFLIMMMAPLVNLCNSIQRTFLAVTIINVSAYILVLMLVWRGTGLSAIAVAGTAGLLALLALDWQPFLANLRQGQVGIMVALLTTAAWYLLRTKPLMAGSLIGLATLIKMFPALLLVWLFLRNRRAFFAAICTVIIAIIVVYLVRGPDAFVDYSRAAAVVEEEFGRARNNFSLSAIVSYVVAGPAGKSRSALVASLFVNLLVFGYTLAVTMRDRQPSQSDIDREFCCYLVLACLLSPTAEAFYYPIFLLPIVIVALGIPSRAILPRTIPLIGIVCCLSFPDQVVWRATEYIGHFVGHRIAWLICSLPTFAMLGLWNSTLRHNPRASAGVA
jgi:hypothetical protein